MKTAISIDDQTFARADKLAQELSMSRSEFYADAVRRRIRELEDARITETINRVLDDPASADPETQALVRAAGKRTLGRNEW
ncbi:hypothetical protein [Deinococcus sp.]|uniref:hypothetical protein n=1 Tax=Deinococcus sp. TaxID=47478 RepID=UPI002869BB70|nr:hypothetical protein [Deinococcus sp.]